MFKREDISRLVEGWSEVVVARRDAKQWLSHKLGIDINIPTLMETMDLSDQSQDGKGDKINSCCTNDLSLP